MRKIKKTDLLQLVQEQAEMIAELSAMVELNKMSIIKLENERDIAKELTGSDLARAMLARGDRWILCGNTTDGFAGPCIIDGYRCSEDDLGFVLTNGKSIEPKYIYPVNNQGEPLTASEAGL